MDEEFVSPRTQLRGRGCGRGVDGRAGGERAAAGIGRRRCADRPVCVNVQYGGISTPAPNGPPVNPSPCSWCATSATAGSAASAPRAVRVPAAQGHDQHRAVRLTRASRRRNDVAGLLGPTARCWTRRPARRRLARQVTDAARPGPSASPRPRSSAPTSSARAAPASPGVGSYADTLATAAALNRLGKESVEGGVGPATSTTARVSSTPSTSTAARRSRPGRSSWTTRTRATSTPRSTLWSSDALNDVTGTQTAALINPIPDARAAPARQGRHQRRRAAEPDQQPLAARRAPRARARSTSGRSSPRPRTACSTSTRSTTAARSPTPTSRSRTSRASARRSSRPSSACPRRSRPRRPARPVPPRR